MNPTIKKALNDQANHELFAAQSYFTMALWCQDKDYAGYAEFFFKQAEEEREHADKFFGHLADRGVLPEVSAMEAPKADFKKLLDVAQHAETLERYNTEAIHRCYEISLEVKDYYVQPLLLKFIEEQVEEEAWTGSMVTLTRRAECSGASYNLDRHIVKTLTSPEAVEL
ncbi:ferritin [Cerasicoccus maritimus]|uniref:ferritin n=1 Tax=Cerasicoccus maritimus TaxID=490089 RepID=UPI0028529A71|nr:ferritin [Cerasicoccus maritimus]